MPVLKHISGHTETVKGAILHPVKVVEKPVVDKETGEVQPDPATGGPIMKRASRAPARDHHHRGPVSKNGKKYGLGPVRAQTDAMGRGMEPTRIGRGKV